ncbi:MAG: heparinase II/III family protein [Arcicella sp.]|nr:heparinase II/III family protein [Arcicella sp.]
MKTILLRYFHTIIHLRPIQIYYQIFYRSRAFYRKLVGLRYAQFVPAKSHLIFLKPPIFNNQSYFPAENRFCFLNQSQIFDPSQIQWNDERSFGKLWVYHLNYFDYLNQENLNVSEGLALIRAHINDYPNLVVGLEPYPISLRNMNWIKFLSKYQIQDTQIDDFLMAQYVRLMDNLEYHLLGNHLLENAFSLLFGAYYFRNDNFFKTAQNILKKELTEQVLADGCHVERSVMYHQIILFRLLDCINLVTQHTRPQDNEIKAMLIPKAQIMLSFLHEISFQNGEIPLMGDAVRCHAPTTKQLIEYANRLEISSQKVNLSDSKYRKYNQENYELVVNVGSPSPSYLPAHSHCDIFSFVLHVRGQPFIVDTGTSTYEPDEIRWKERSTSAHNTVQIGDAEQSEIWGSFRMARRAKTVISTENQQAITASHDGYARLGIIHQRSFRVDKNQIFIKDDTFGVSKYPQKAYFHFHPSLEITLSNNKVTTPLGSIEFEGATAILESEYAYAEEFNKRINAKMITLLFYSSLQSNITIY